MLSAMPSWPHSVSAANEPAPLGSPPGLSTPWPDARRGGRKTCGMRDPARVNGDHAALLMCLAASWPPGHGHPETPGDRAWYPRSHSTRGQLSTKPTGARWDLDGIWMRSGWDLSRWDLDGWALEGICLDGWDLDGVWMDGIWIDGVCLGFLTLRWHFSVSTASFRTVCRATQVTLDLPY
jgi:hypothetical protein